MKAILVRIIRLYQMISRALPATPVLLGGFSGCRSWPTCSDYAIDAIQRHGVVMGGLKSIVRIARCNPL